MQHTHTRGFMALYRNVRYWLSDFRSGGKVVGKEEIFNSCHARLRNVIERAFGVVKVRFPILKRMTPYSFTTQTKIVMACFSIHNFLRQISVTNDYFLNMTMKWNWKVTMPIKIKTQLQAVFLQHLIKNSCNSSKTKSQMNSFKYLIILSFLVFYRCKKCNV